jgi:hypothetical protein
MAATLIGAQLTELQRAAQLRLAAQTISQMRAAWGLLDPADLDATFEQWLRVAVPVVQANRVVSSRLAGAYLAAFRHVELGSIAASVPVVLAAPVDVKAVTTSLLVTGPWSMKTAMTRGVARDQAADVAQARTAAAGMRHALDGGRTTILDTVAADRHALGWARVASGNACAFCAMVASRGPDYTSEATANFEAHDGCQCGAEPVYQADAAWPSNSQRYRDLWDEHAAGADDPLNSFRRALGGG